MSDDDATFVVYDFDANGFHQGRQYVAQKDLETVVLPIIQRAIAERRSVTITDSGDFCVYELKDGVLVWPSEEAMAESVIAEALKLRLN